jgi:hypothetical protein
MSYRRMPMRELMNLARLRFAERCSYSEIAPSLGMARSPDRDFVKIATELKRKGLTRKQLWREHVAEHDEHELGYAQFCARPSEHQERSTVTYFRGTHKRPQGAPIVRLGERTYFVCQHSRIGGDWDFHSACAIRSSVSASCR